MRRQVLLSALFAAVGTPWKPRNEPPPLDGLSPASAINDVDDDRGRAVGDDLPPVIVHKPKFGGGGLRPAGWSGGRSPGGALWRWRVISSGGSRDGAFSVVMVIGDYRCGDWVRSKLLGVSAYIMQARQHRPVISCEVGVSRVSACRRHCLIGHKRDVGVVHSSSSSSSTIASNSGRHVSRPPTNNENAWISKLLVT